MNDSITEIDIAIRLCLSFAAGGIIGFERSSHRQVAGLRTHILIAVGACCLMLLSIWLPQSMGMANGDPGRIAAQVVSGMGFLGAGAILRLGNDIKGLTTAASLWLIAAVGMTVGAGMYVTALITEALTLIALMLLNPIERKIFPEIRDKLLELHYIHSAEPNIEPTADILQKFNIKNEFLGCHLGQDGKKTKVRFAVSIIDTLDMSKLVESLESCGDIDHVEIKEKFL